MSHNQPTYASVPGIRVYGMICVHSSHVGTIRRGKRFSSSRDIPPFPWHEVIKLYKTAIWN